jgi:hypothetical protein
VGGQDVTVDAFRRLYAWQIQEIALGLGQHDSEDEVCAARERARAAWQRARDRIAERLLDEVWKQGVASDVGLWGEQLCRVEASRLLRHAIDSGMVYLDVDEEPDRHDQRGPWSWPRRALARLFGTGTARDMPIADERRELGALRGGPEGEAPVRKR